MTAHDPRVTLTEAERRSLVEPFQRWLMDPEGVELSGVMSGSVERIIAARLAPIRALADEWERNCSNMLIGGFSGCSIGADTAAKRLRAALDAASAPVSASQDDDGAEGQGESERAGEGDVSNLVHNHPPYRPICAERFAGNHIRGACLNDDGSPR